MDRQTARDRDILQAIIVHTNETQRERERERERETSRLSQMNRQTARGGDTLQVIIVHLNERKCLLSLSRRVAVQELYGKRFQKDHGQQTSSCEGE